MLNSLLGEACILNLPGQVPAEFPSTMESVTLKIRTGELKHEL